MKHSRVLIAILLLALVLPPFSAQAGIQAGWQALAPGIDFQKFSVTGPNEVFVVRMDRNHPSATIDTSLANGKLNNPVTQTSNGIVYDWESIPGQAQRYDGTLNFWGRQWGSRNQVVVAINGDYHDATGLPQQGQIQSGWYTKRFSDGQRNSGFVWTQDREAFIGGCVRHISTEQQFYLWNDTDAGKNLQGVNLSADSRPENSYVLYTPQFDNFTPLLDGVYEVLIEMSGPAQLISKPDQVIGIVRETGPKGGMMIPFNHVVISATGTKVPLLKNLVAGDPVGISQKVSPGCNISDPSFDWSDAYAGIGGDFTFLKNGNINPYSSNGGATGLAPRTAIAFNASYLYFIVVDGRNAGVSVGMNMAGLGDFALRYLQATDGISVDSGSSSTMVVNGKIVNNVYCNYTGCKNNSPSPNNPDVPGYPWENIASYDKSDELEAEIAGRTVVNGLMMIAVQPAAFSSSYTPGNELNTLFATALRLGPGNNYARVLTVPAGATVTVVEQFNNLNGVMATGEFWWKVRYDSPTYGMKEGWIIQSAFGFTATDWSFLPFLGR